MWAEYSGLKYPNSFAVPSEQLLSKLALEQMSTVTMAIVKLVTEN